MRSRVKLGLLLLVGVLCFGVVWRLFLSGAAISRWTYEQIEIGMTEKQVEMLLGMPSGDYSTGQLMTDVPGPNGTTRQAYLAPLPYVFPKCTNWITDNGSVAVFFDDGRVRNKYFINTQRKSENYLGRFRRWLGL